MVKNSLSQSDCSIWKSWYLVYCQADFSDFCSVSGFQEWTVSGFQVWKMWTKCFGPERFLLRGQNGSFLPFWAKSTFLAIFFILLILFAYIWLKIVKKTREKNDFCPFGRFLWFENGHFWAEKCIFGHIFFALFWLSLVKYCQKTYGWNKNDFGLLVIFLGVKKPFLAYFWNFLLFVFKFG